MTAVILSSACRDYPIGSNSRVRHAHVVLNNFFVTTFFAQLTLRETYPKQDFLSIRFIRHDLLFCKVMSDRARSLGLILLFYLTKPHGQQRGLAEQVLDLIQPSVPERFVGDIDPELTEDILRRI